MAAPSAQPLAASAVAAESPASKKLKLLKRPGPSVDAHPAAVFSIAAIPDSNQLLSTGGDSLFKTWNCTQADMKVMSEVKVHSDLVFAMKLVAKGGSGPLVASGDRKGVVKVWALNGGEGDAKTLPEDRLRFTASTPIDVVYSACYQAETNRLLVGGGGDSKKFTIHQWNFETGEEYEPLAGHTNAVHGLTSIPGNLIASGAEDHNICLHRNPGSGHVATLKGHSATIRALAWLNSFHTLVSCGSDGLRTWGLFTQDSNRVLSEHKGTCLVTVNEGDHAEFHLASGNDDGNVVLWDLRVGTAVQVLAGGHKKGILSIALLSDGTLASAGGLKDATIRLWI